jgi:hypothetical protein
MVPKRQDEAIQMGQSMSNLQSQEYVSLNLVVMGHHILLQFSSLAFPDNAKPLIDFHT